MINNTQAQIYAQLQHKALHISMDSERARHITSATTPARQRALDVESYQAETVSASPSTKTICWQWMVPDPAGTET